MPAAAETLQTAVEEAEGALVDSEPGSVVVVAAAATLTTVEEEVAGAEVEEIAGEVVLVGPAQAARSRTANTPASTAISMHIFFIGASTTSGRSRRLPNARS